MKLRKMLAHCRMHYVWPHYFSAGEAGCCAVWYYRTPWGALWAARRRHKARTRPVPPPPAWIAECSTAIASGALLAALGAPDNRGMYGVIPTERILRDPPQWPEGQPVTPWADPWHDVAGDVRDAMREAE